MHHAQTVTLILYFQVLLGGSSFLYSDATQLITNTLFSFPVSVKRYDDALSNDSYYELMIQFNFSR